MKTVSPNSEKIKPELLAPGGSLEKCRIAFLYGADAVYVGGKEYSLRAFARNLTREEIAAACGLAHQLGKKIYVTVNAFAREADIETIPDFLTYLRQIDVDGLIVSDPGILLLARKHAPDVPVHLSTQANTTNSQSILFWKYQGISRVNLARELSFGELQRISMHSPLELEIFVHGAMCVSYSGRCLLSAYLNERSANQGLCSQPCRWSYRLVEEKRPGQYFPVYEDSRGSYIFNSRDMCLLEELGQLMSLPIHSFKVEGRMKGALYLASVIRTYRQAIDRYWDNPSAFAVQDSWQQDLARVSHRPYTKGLLFPGSAGDHQGIAPTVSYFQTHTLAGLVRQSTQVPSSHADTTNSPKMNFIDVEVRSRIFPGKTLEFLYPDGSTLSHRVYHIEDLNGHPLSVVHPNSFARFSVPFRTFPLQVIRMEQDQ